MPRQARKLFLAVWIVGAFMGGLTVQPPLPSSPNESLTLLIDTDHVSLGVNRTHVVLAVTPPWQSEWRVAAPRPDRLGSSPPEKASSAPQSEASTAPSIVPFFIRSLVPLP